MIDNITAALRTAKQVSTRQALDALFMSRQHIAACGGLDAIADNGPAMGINFVYIVDDRDYTVVIKKINLRDVLRSR